MVFGMAVGATAKPLEVKSENFIFYGDVSEKSAITLIEGLEEYREIILTLFQVDPVPETMPIKVIGVPSPDKVEKLTGWKNSSGVYVTTMEGPLFILSSKGGFRPGKPASRIAYHEYAHHLVANYTNQFYPKWFNEGFAEYLSTFEVNKKGVVSIGLPNDSRGYALNQKNWIPMDVFVRAVRQYPYANTADKDTRNIQSLFYSQSWLAVHYIQSTPGMNDKFNKYLRLINQTTVPNNAFEQGFGMSPDEFGELLRAYFKKNRFLTSRITLKDSYVPKKAEVREISKVELNLRLGDSSRFFSRKNSPSEYASELLDKVEASGGLKGELATTRAYIALRNKEYSKALSYAEDAVRFLPDDPKANTVLGAAYLEQYEENNDADQLKRARKALKHAMRQNPDFVHAHYLYAKSYHDERSTSPSKQAIASAESALLYYRAQHFMGANLEMATVLLNSDDASLAVPALQRVLARGRLPSMRRFAEQQIQRLKAKQARTGSNN